ncbi:coiled-coil domain-containing protein 173-like [Megalops cyprinoides]|uniref:coiled-coil domain-containing protein 173-like n=1 Tax=Megalops cyprinoides TaxID=118141 RepID=UPI001863BF71|nr:coiled-coil domain-containing protein 173-like [Megalops cyprinoides]
METPSVSVEVKVSGKGKGLQGKRQEAIAKGIRHEFYQSDRVKQFHRALLLTETLKERDDQVEVEQEMAHAASEDLKNIIAEIRRIWLEAVEQDRQKLRKQKMETKTVGDYVRQQMREHDLMREQRRQEKQKEVDECRRLREKYEEEKRVLRQKQQEEQMNTRKAHFELLSTTSTIRALEAQKQEMEEERRRFFENERDKMVMKRKERKAERKSVVQRYKEIVAGRLAAELQEKISKEEEHDTRVLANSIAKLEAKLAWERREKNEKKAAVLKTIAMHREYKIKDLEQKAREEKQSAEDALHATKEEDRIFWEAQQIKAQQRMEERKIIDRILHCQTAERCAQENLLKQEEMDFDNKYEELIAEEEAQFQEYAARVISMAKKCNRNIFPLLRNTRKGMWCGVGPISGGTRANYLVPGADYDQLPDYVSSTTQDLKRLYGTVDNQPGTKKLEFIW